MIAVSIHGQHMVIIDSFVQFNKVLKMKKQNKYSYFYVLQGNYGYGWDNLMEWDKSKDDLPYRSSREHLTWYRQNEKQALHRIIERRELNK